MKKQKVKFRKAEAEIVRFTEQIIVTSGFNGEGEDVGGNVQNGGMNDFNTL